MPGFLNETAGTTPKVHSPTERSALLYPVNLVEKLLRLQPRRMRPQGALSLRLSSAALQQHVWLMTD